MEGKTEREKNKEHLSMKIGWLDRKGKEKKYSEFLTRSIYKVGKIQRPL